MKKLVGLFAVLLLVFACDSDSDSFASGMQAQTNDEYNTTEFQYLTWRPKRIDAVLANENVLQLRGETDSTKFVIRVPYTIKEGEDSIIELGDLIGDEVDQTGQKLQDNFKQSNADAAYAFYSIKDKFDNVTTARFSTTGVEHKGHVVLYKAENQIPGTISGEFFVNLELEPSSDNLSPKQKEIYNSLSKFKTFQQGNFFRITLEAAK